MQLRVAPRPKKRRQVRPGRQRPLQGVQIHRGRHGTEEDRHILGGSGLQGDVQRQPGRQSQLLGLELALFGVQSGDLPLQRIEASGIVQCGAVGLVIKERGLRDHRRGLNREPFSLGAYFFRVLSAASAPGLRLPRLD